MSIEKFALLNISPKNKIGEQGMEYDPAQEKISLIEDMPIDVDEKVELLLILGSAKAAADIELLGDTWRVGEEPMHVDEEKLKEIKQTLQKLGMAFEVKAPVTDKSVYVEDDSIPIDGIKPEDEIHETRERVVIDISSNAEIMLEIKKALAEGNHQKIGELYGFPKTAVEEFLKGELEDKKQRFGRSDLPENLRNEEWTLFATYKFSRDNWKQELNTAKKWATIVKKMSSSIYSEYIEKMREVDKF